MIDSREKLLRLARDADDPTPPDEERVLHALRDTLGATRAARRPRAGEAARRGKLLASAGKLSALLVGLGLLAVVTVMTRAHKAHPALAPSQAPIVSPHALPQRSQPPPIPNQAAPLPTAPRQVTPRSRTAKRSALPSTPAADGGLQAELALLRRVQSALRERDGTRALRELDTYSERHGALLAERRAARILALCLLQRVEDARRAAAEFALAHPGSAHAAAIAGSCTNAQRIDPR